MTTPNRPPVRNYRTNPDPPAPLPFDERIREMISATIREGYFKKLSRLPDLYLRLAFQWETSGSIYHRFDSVEEGLEEDNWLNKYLFSSLKEEFWLYDLADMLLVP